MTDQTFEQRVAAAIAAFADLAPTDVEPLTMTRLAAAGSRRVGPIWFGSLPTGRGLVVAVVVLMVLVTMLASAFVAGGYLRERGLLGLPTERTFVEPFIGLPPEDAAPSEPEQGELVLSFSGRVQSPGGGFHRLWVYADGRLVWTSTLASHRAGLDIWAERFEGAEPTTAIIEQRLTPDGVDLVRSDAIASARIIGPVSDDRDTTVWGRPGVLWGSLTLGDGDRLLDADWSDPGLPARLADPGSWLPPSAWADRRIRGYVPSHYALCAWPNGPSLSLERLPDAVQALVLSKGIRVPGSGLPPGDCYAVTTEVARAIVAAFDTAGHALALGRGPISYVFPDETVPDGEVTVDLLELTPHGEVVCNCG